MMKMKRTAMLAMSVALSLAGMSYAQVLEKVPGDALVVVKVNKLAATSGKVAKLAETLGLTAFEPKLADPLAAIKDQLKITGGLDDNGEFAFVYLDPKGGDKEKSMIMLVPSSDHNALIAGLENAKTEGDITIFTGQNGDEGFIADWGGYAAISPSRELVAAKPSTTLKVTGRSAKELADNDITVFANLVGLREQLTAELAKNREEAKAEFLTGLKDNAELPEKYHPAIEVAVDQFFNVAEAFLRDADGATVGFTITDNGIRENIVAEFKSDSYIGKWVGALKKTDASLLTGLPATKYFLYGGQISSPEALSQAIDDIAGPIVAALPQDDEKLAFVPELIADTKSLMSEVKGQSFGLLAPQGGFGQEPVIQTISRTEGNGDTLLPKLRAFNEKYNKIVADLTGDVQGFTMKQTWTDDAKEIDGVKFALSSNEIEGDSDQANQARQMHQFIYGSQRQDIYFASTGDEVLNFMGVSDDNVKALIAAAKANEAPLAKSEGLVAVSGQLPKSRMAEVYVSVDEIVGYGLRTAAMFGAAPGNIVLPPELPPVGVAVAGDNSSLEVSVFVPTDLMQALVTAGIQVYSNAAGGGSRQGGGGLE